MKARDGKVLVRFATVRREMYIRLAGHTYHAAVGRIYGSNGYGVATKPAGALGPWSLHSGPWPTSAQAVVAYAQLVEELSMESRQGVLFGSTPRA